MENFEIRSKNHDFYINAGDFGARGSEYEAAATSSAGSALLEVCEIGDFLVGDEVLVKGANPHVKAATLFERRDLSTLNPRPYRHSQPILDRIEIEGFDGTQGDWVVYFVDIFPEEPEIFRWSNDYGKVWHTLPLSEGWIELCSGIRIRINDFAERSWGCTAVFVCSSRLVAKIEKIENKTVTLSAPASISGECTMLHSDSSALQAAIDAAVSAGKNLFIPNGHYRLTSSLIVTNPTALTIEGENELNTVLDNSLGNLGIEKFQGSCFHISGGNSFTLKNVSMVGGLGFKDRAQGARLDTKGGSSVYGFYFNKSNATCVRGTRKVLIENCHARKMSAECFYAQGPNRESGESYTESLTYRGCSVEDCARNAFNNNDFSENTSILNCRVKDVGNDMWEGASRLTIISGCYAYNSGPIEVGNVRGRRPFLNDFGTGQIIITNNYFDGGVSASDEAPNAPPKPMINIGSSASQAIIKDNVFINFNSPAIAHKGEGMSIDTPPENVIISGNSIDLTATRTPSVSRYGIRITSDFATVSDNHIFVRGKRDENVTGIILSDDVSRISIHDNTLFNLECGIQSIWAEGAVGTIIDDRTFLRKEGALFVKMRPMLLRPGTHRYENWIFKWQSDQTESEVLDFDPISLKFTLKEPRTLTVGEKFYIIPKPALPWSIHHNVVDCCKYPLSLDTYSGKRAKLSENIF